jgi:hypothetical protein
MISGSEFLVMLSSKKDSTAECGKLGSGAGMRREMTLAELKREMAGLKLTQLLKLEKWLSDRDLS